MAFYNGPTYLAPAGTTGNNTHASVQVPADADQVVAEFVVEAIGATPTVTWKVQGSIDDINITDAASGWFDLRYVTDSTETVAAAGIVATAVGKQVIFLADEVDRYWRKMRLVTSANTNVTYRGELYIVDAE